MSELATQTIVLLGLAAFVAGFVDAIAGGGALITVPALLLGGFSPVQALATNKLQGLFSTGSATIHYAANGHVDLRRQLPAAALAFAGGVAGAFLATIVPGEFMQMVLPPVLVAIALYFALKPRMDDLDRASRVSPFLLGLTVVPLIGFYDGVFGPGAGSFYMLAFVTLAGYGILKATAHSKLMNFASNLGGFSAFALAGVVSWKIGLMMGAAAFLGARVGAALAIRNGARLIKPLLVVVCLALALRLLWDPGHPLRTMIGV